MSPRKIVLTAGFAMFSMFFGSGNLVFPLLIGTQTLDQYPFSTMGLIVTAVFVPLLGLTSMILYEGNYNNYFSRLGKVPSFILITIMLSLIGPFGVIPRCITVAYGGVSLMFPALPLWLFSLVFCIIIMGLVWQKNRIVEIIGLFLTPFKLGGIALLLLAGLLTGEAPTASSLTSTEAFFKGFMRGYQTMDLIAAFFFSSATYYYLRDHMKGGMADPKSLLRPSFVACSIAAAILSLAYIGFVSLGAKYAPLLEGLRSEEMLSAVAGHALGTYATPVLAFTVAVACLATAVILSSLFVEFLKDDVSKDQLSHPQCIYLTMATTFAMSLLGFAAICDFLEEILVVAYPALIVYALANIANKTMNFQYVKIPFWLTLFLSGAYKVFTVIG